MCVPTCSHFSNLTLLSCLCRGLKQGALLSLLDYLVKLEGSPNSLLIKIESTDQDRNRDEDKHHHEDDGGGGGAVAIACCGLLWVSWKPYPDPEDRSSGS